MNSTNPYISKLRNLDNSFVDKTIPTVSVSAINGCLGPEFDKEGVAKKCEEKGKQKQCQWTGMTAEQIMKLWEDKAALSMDYGKRLDSYVEAKLEGDDDTMQIWELDNDREGDERLSNHCTAFDEFYDRIMKSGDVVYVGREIEVYNRVKIGNSDFYVKGRLDALFYNKRTDTWIVIDWKSNECITTRGNKWTEHLLGPAKSLLNLDWNTYTFQVYNYKEALLQNYLPEGTDVSHVQCMIVNLPKMPYENADAAIGKGQKYKAYMPAFPYNEEFVNKVYEFGYKKNLILKKKQKAEEKTEEIQQQQEVSFDLF